MNWEQLFKPHILERGKEYYQDGCVEDLEEENGQITAVVEGAEEYDVNIELDGDSVEWMECTCPYAEGGENCKHMAAVLYAWEQGGSPKKAPSKSAQDDYAQLKACVDGADEALVRRTLTDLLWQDEKQRLRFMAEARPERASELVRSVKAMVDGIERRYMARGYIDYREAGGFIGELEDILANEVDTRMARGQDRDAFEISTYVFMALDGVDMDDSDGGITIIADECQNDWETIAARADEALKREMFDWLLAHCGGKIIDYLEDYCEDTLMNGFDAPEYMEKKLAFAQSALVRALKENDDDWKRQYHGNHHAANCLRLMEQMGRSEDELTAFCRAHWELSRMREYYIDRCRQTGWWDEVISVLKESIAMNEAKGSNTASYHMQLKDAYAQLGQADAYRQELWEIVTRICPADMDCFREYRALFGDDAWPAERERLFDALPKHANVAALYAEEKLYDRLLERVIASDGLYMLRQYEAALSPKYPEQVLEKYAQEINQTARNTATRSTYQGWVETLRHMRTIPGGPCIVNEIAAEWRKLYNRRKAMMEELSKL